MKKIGEIKGKKITSTIPGNVEENIITMMKRHSSKNILHRFMDEYSSTSDDTAYYLSEVSYDISKQADKERTGLFRKKEIDVEHISVESHAEVFIEG